MIKNCIFDIDGTLTDSMPVWDNVGQEFLIAQGITPPDNLDEIFRSMSFEESAAYFQKNLGMKLTAKEMIETIISMVAKKYLNEVPLKEGVYGFLKSNYEKGIKMTALTASEKDYIVPCIKKLGIFDFFENVYSCTELGMSKSSGHIYEFVADKMGYIKEETAVFEDALHAAKSAKDCGYTVVGIYDKSSEYAMEDMKNICDKYIFDYNNLEL